jgi:hypothetical protein
MPGYEVFVPMRIGTASFFSLVYIVSQVSSFFCLFRAELDIIFQWLEEKSTGANPKIVSYNATSSLCSAFWKQKNVHLL